MNITAGRYLKVAEVPPSDGRSGGPLLTLLPPRPALLPGRHAGLGADGHVGRLQLAVFAPGTYHVADYIISWTFPELAGLHDTRPGPPLVITIEDTSPPAAAAPDSTAGSAGPAAPSLIDLL